MFRFKSELDEYYDSKRQLGKLVIRSVDGTIVELFVRPLEGYYVVHRGNYQCLYHHFGSFFSVLKLDFLLY